MRVSDTRRRRAGRPGKTVLSLATCGALLLVVGLAEPAEARPSYQAFARANLVDTVIANPSIPTGLDIEGAGPAAQTAQSSGGQGDANAQMPYSGNTVPGLPGTVGSLVGLPVPPYPFIAASTRGSRPSQVSYPGISLDAESNAFNTLASAVVGGDSSGGTSKARIDEEEDGTVTARASTTADTLRFGNVLDLSGVRTTAVVTADGATGQLTRTTSTSIGRMSVPGLVLDIPESSPPGVPLPLPDGVPQPPLLPTFPVPAGGQQLKDPELALKDGVFSVTVPVGGQEQEFAVPAAAVLAGLEDAGITMTYQAPERTSTGIVSGAYRFQYTIAAPPRNAAYSGPTKVTQTTGLAVASVALKPAGQASSVSSGGGSGTPGAGPAGAPSGPGSQDEAGAGTATSTDALDEEATGGAPAAGLEGGSTTPLARATPAAAGSLAQPLTDVPSIRLAGVTFDFDIKNIYLVLVAVGLVGLTSSTALRLIGVRFLWTS